MDFETEEVYGASAEDIILECRGIVKKFPGNLALDNVDLSVRRGEIHALVGQNGAGKSTMVKIITGVYSSDGGEIEVDHRSVKLDRPQDAEREGIAIIHQDQQLVPQFDVKRNIYLGREIKKHGFLDFASMREESQKVLDMIGVSFTPDELVGNLSVGQREQVAIASALLKQPKILILDEPTASLSRKEVEQLFEIIRNLKKQGVTILYISHHFDEIFEISDRITVLRDGKKVSTLNIGECSKRDVIEIMIGRKVSQLYPKQNCVQEEPLFEVNSLNYQDKLKNISFTLNKGEILGVAGILGSGISELALCLFGVDKFDAASVSIHGERINLKSPVEAKKYGIALIPEDRRTEGFVSGMTIKENLSLPFVENFGKRGVLKKKLEKERAEGVVDLLHIKTTGIEQLIDNLSGGNQQKVVIGKWLLGNSEVFILNQPTTGVDVGSKIEIYGAMMELAKNGAGIIIISQDFEELAGMSDRIIIMSDGEITKELEGSQTSENEILHYATNSGR